MSALADNPVIQLKSFFGRGRKEKFEDRTDYEGCPRRGALAARKKKDDSDPNQKRRVQNDLFAPTLKFLIPGF